MNEVAYGIDVIFDLFGERQILSHEPGASLSEGVIEPFDMIGFSLILGIGMSFSWKSGCIGIPIIGIKIGCLPDRFWHAIPQSPRPLF